MISTRPLISKSSCPCINPLVTVSRALITINIIVTFMFHSFFNSLAKSRYLPFFSLSFSFTLWSVKSTILQILFLLLIIIWSGRLIEIRWSVCMSKPQRSLCVLFSKTGPGLCIYYLFVWSSFNFMHDSAEITQSCLVLHSFCTSFLYSLIMRVIISFLSPHNLNLLFCWVLSILALIWLVLMALFCATIRRDSVSLLKFPYLRHVHVFSWVMSFVSSYKRPWCCFSSHFCFLLIVILFVFVLSVLFLVAVINLPPRFSM